ncbi:MAG: VOC family protein [Cyanobacteriota bacterium]|nr:VOC family protein [Cyanobacteriota bacterium]
MSIRPFHVAFPVKNLEETRHFYHHILGCPIGRSSDTWIDFNLFDHQITAHLSLSSSPTSVSNVVDGKAVPVQHWGVILEMTQWQAFADHLKGQGIPFLIEPHIRFVGEVGEQATLFFQDPDGHTLEFKAFASDGGIFAH